MRRLPALLNSFGLPADVLAGDDTAALLLRRNRFLKFDDPSPRRQTRTESPALILRSNCLEGTMANLDGGYQPEELMLFRRLFEECIKGLPESNRTAINQGRIAKQLLECAATGERNPIELRIAATADDKKAA
jgi:hypothetical protein